MDDRKTAVITGASRGLGREFTRLLAEDGYDLVITARDEQALETLSDELMSSFPVRVEFVSADLSTDDGASKVSRYISGKNIGVDILINNAGFGIFGDFSKNKSEDISNMIGCNVSSLTLLTRSLLPGMIERGGGRILNVASTASFRPGPMMAVYSATRAYILSFSRALSSELQNSGITVTALCPGPIDTGFARRAGIKRSKIAEKRKAAPVGKVALYGYRAMLRGKRIAIDGAANRLFIFALRFLPSRFVDDLSGKTRRRD
ncbi:MAG: SDR family oxidoreductase [Candidatus Krumholzibacteriota bacterium]|nr:SDR family oxidoreductase [Candidatus Krumholzibacteriota bacterium]